MGDSNGQVELSCPGCATTFHLRPRKAKMPRNPIPCPKCGTPIEMSGQQLRLLRKIVGTQTPAAQVIRTRGRGPDDDALEEMDRLADELENTQPRVSSTLIGYPISSGDSDGFERSSNDHKTRESDKSLEKAGETAAADMGQPSQTSEIPKEEVDRARASMLGRIKPEKRPAFSSFGSEADEDPRQKPSEHEEHADDVHNATTARPPGMPPLSPGPLSEIHDEKTPPKGKVPLSELLKKVRDKRNTEGISIPPLGGSNLGPESSSTDSVGHTTDEVFEDIVDDVVGGATERLAPVRETAAGTPAAPGGSGEISGPSSTERTENSMLSRLKKIPRSGLREKPGMAGERRGSGYIRLPESEILDLLGDGNYRLRVEDIVYEPIGDDAIIGLIKAGKLKGKDEIANADGDWRRLSQHPLFIEHHEPEPLPTPHEEPGKSTRQMFGAVKPQAEHVPPPTSAEREQVPPPIEKRTSSASGEWVQTNLDATLDNLPAGRGPHTPPPNQPEPRAPHHTTEPGETTAPPAGAGPDFESPEEPEEHRLDGPPSYPAIALPDEPPQPQTKQAAGDAPPRKRTLLPVLAGLFIFGGVIAGAGFLYTTGAFDSVLGSAASLSDTAATSANATTSAAATSPAETTPEQPPEPTLQEKIATAVAAKDWSTALPLLEQQWNDSATPDHALALIDARIASGKFRSARLLIFEARDLAGADPTAFDERFAQSLTEQASVERKNIEIGADWTDLELVSTRPLNYRIVDAEGQAWRFIPAQSNGITPRAEIAFYQLCGVVECRFDVPTTMPATVTKDVLEGLARDDVSLAKIEWSDDGVTTGALRQAVEEQHVGYPIENTGAWRNWLDSNDDPKALETPFTDSLDYFDESTRAQLEQESDGASTGEIARQIANILSADFLVNNFDRFATSSDRYGSTVRLVDSTLVSVTNSAAFQPRDSNRVRGRFGWTSRFDPEFVESVRQLDRESIDPILFPGATRGEEARLDVFWDQRDKLLSRVDSLVKRRSEESVLPF